MLVGALLIAGMLGLGGARAATTAAGPSVAFTTPAPTGAVHGVLALAGTAQAPAGIAKVELRVDEGPYQLVSGTSNWTFSLDTAAYGDGQHDLKARVTDSAGTQAWADLLVVFQNTAAGQVAPRVTFTSPAAGAKLKQAVVVRGTASAPLGIARVEIRIDTGPYQVATGLASWSVKLDTNLQVDGRHTLSARVTDSVGTQVVSRRAVVFSNHAGQIYWGALVSGHLYGYGDPPSDMRGLRVFEQHAGKKVSMLAVGTNWGSKHPNFPINGMNAIRDHGSIPFFSWGSKGPGGTEQPKYTLANIINGKFDGYIRSFALAAKTWGHPFFLRFDWEMNLIGTFPWIETVNGNSRGQFVKMWRHVHNIFTNVGATKVTWVWCPNAEYNGSSKPLSQLYPGNAYVDWTCIDGYNWGIKRNVWQTFNQVMGPTYKDILANVAPSKPVMIGETGSSEFGGSKAAWIRDTLSIEVPHVFRRVKAFIWFNVHDKADWQIETSRKAEAAFHAAIGSRFYAGADFGSLPNEKIRPLAP